MRTAELSEDVRGAFKFVQMTLIFSFIFAFVFVFSVVELLEKSVD